MKPLISLTRVAIPAAVALTATMGGCTGRGEKEQSHIFPSEVKTVADAILTDSARAFASAVSYPLDRPYPLHNIPDSVTMVRYFPTMVDDSLKQAVVSAPDSLWSQAGWRGWTLDSGEYFWIDSGKIYAMDYVSAGERMLLDSLRREEIATLSPSMRKGWEPVTCVVDSVAETVFRIDRYILGKDSVPADSATYRLAVYSINNLLDSTPSRLLYGHLDPEGSMGSRFYHFGDSAGVTANYSPDLMMEDSVPSVEINNNGTLRSYYARQGYWLDMIKASQEARDNIKSVIRNAHHEGYLNGIVQTTEYSPTHQLEVDSTR